MRLFFKHIIILFLLLSLLPLDSIFTLINIEKVSVQKAIENDDTESNDFGEKEVKDKVIVYLTSHKKCSKSKGQVIPLTHQIYTGYYRTTETPPPDIY